jgi:hypothetical protein
VEFDLGFAGEKLRVFGTVGGGVGWEGFDWPVHPAIIGEKAKITLCRFSRMMKK